jgi:hypothetical protein
LINKDLVSEKIDDNYSKYSKNIISIFEFIGNKSERPKLLNTIGNTLRITVEMFCTFNYREGIEKTLENARNSKIIKGQERLLSVSNYEVGV